jgi:hypothetical protein
MHYMPTEHVPIEVKILRDVAMLRKLNNDLISSSWMDDFLVDCYMKMYKLVREDGRRPETAISIPSTSREASVSGDGEEVRIRPARASRREILQKVAALCRPPPVPAKVLGSCLRGLISGTGKACSRGGDCSGRRDVDEIGVTTAVTTTIARSDGNRSPKWHTENWQPGRDHIIEL